MNIQNRGTEVKEGLKWNVFSFYRLEGNGSDRNDWPPSHLQEIDVFRIFWPGEVAGSWPLVVVPGDALSSIGGRSWTLRLSSETVKSHPRFADFEKEDWLPVQRLLDEGRRFKGPKRPKLAIAFLEEDGRLWRAMIKSTKEGKETYLETLHQAKARDLRSAIRKLEEIGRE